MKNILVRMVDSIRFFANMKYRKEFINPEIRELLEDFHQKKRNQVNKSLNEEEKQISELKNTYEYKNFEHFRKIGFLKTKEKGEKFLKYCNFDIFFDKKRWTRSIFFFRYFHTPKDYTWTKLKAIILFLSCLLALKLGLINGFKDSQLFDEIGENLKDIRTEDHLLALLMEKKVPVLVLYYVTGEYPSYEMQVAQGKFIESWGEDFAIMAKVNCKFNLDLCLKKIQYLSIPQYELMFPPFEEINEQGEVVKKFPVVPCKFNRSVEGIEGFLMEQGVIPDKYNPAYIINKSMRKYV